MHLSFEDLASPEGLTTEINAVPDLLVEQVSDFARLHHRKQKGIGCPLRNMHFLLPVSWLCSLLNFAIDLVSVAEKVGGRPNVRPESPRPLAMSTRDWFRYERTFSYSARPDISQTHICYKAK